MRYRVSDLPAVGTGAFTPIPAMNPVASSYGLVKIRGNPGIYPQPAPRPDPLPPLDNVDGTNGAQPSRVAPDVMAMDNYVAYADNMGPAADAGLGMRRRRLCELPVPALNPVRLPRVAQVRPAIAGREAIAWPRAFQRFPSRNSATDGA